MNSKLSNIIQVGLFADSLESHDSNKQINCQVPKNSDQNDRLDFEL